jgi:hypothetical protein
MTVVQVCLFLAAWLSGAIAMVSSIGAHLAADHSNRNGLVPKKTSDFYDFSTHPFFYGVGPSFKAIFSNVHRQYDSRFITRCIKIARVAFVLAPTFLVAFVISLIVG